MQQAKTVLLVDDDADDQEIFCTAMGRADQSVHCVFANDGIEALEKMNMETSFVPDFIFIDMNMPRMNGRDCLWNIKQIERLKHVPVYMYSTSADPKLIIENKELGAVDYIVKPASINDLTNVLKNIVQNNVALVCMLMALFTMLPHSSNAQKKALPEVSTLKKLSVEELMDIEVTSVSKSPQKLTEVASAIQVLTSEDIRRSPTTLLPEVLRLAPNIQVARSGSHDWSVTSRGFNGAPIANSSLANKLLVMIDGRTVYNPLFGGVYWDVQSVLKENVDRIEVVSGPGGTLWGANAVNGVINVITKNAKETQGLSVNGVFGNFLKDGFSVNYGSHIDSTMYFRVYGQRWDFSGSKLKNGGTANDKWDMTKGGFRMDYMPSGKNQVTLQGELYSGEEDLGDSTLVNGQNVLARWTHTFSEKSSLNFQAYYDRTWRNIKTSPLVDVINTFDIDLNHSFMAGKSNRISYGFGYRVLDDNTISDPSTFDPPRKTLNLLSGYVQDQLTIKPKLLELTYGTKLLSNDYTGLEWQPSIRLAWTPTAQQTLWTAVSRAVRTPSRFDVDIASFRQVSHPEFRSEKVLAYELGYRFHPVGKLSLSLATFYNQYKDLRSFDLTGNPVASIVFGNNLKANTWGFEFSGNYIATKWWRLRGGYTYLDKDFSVLSANTLANTETFEAVDPKSQAILQSIMDLPKNFEFDLFGRYVAKLPEEPFAKRAIPAYFSLDLRLAWSYKFLGLALNVQNITDDRHGEFGDREIPRSIYGRISFRF